VLVIKSSAGVVSGLRSSSSFKDSILAFSKIREAKGLKVGAGDTGFESITLEKNKIATNKFVDAAKVMPDIQFNAFAKKTEDTSE
jgi:hypothetical protein